MNWIFFFFNVILVTIAGWTIFRTHKLNREYDRDYTRYFLYYLTAINVFGFIIYCLSDLIVFLLFSEASEVFKSHFTALVILLAYPIRIAAIYFYINTFLALAEKEFSKKYKNLFFFISALFVPFFALGYYRMLESEYLEILKISYLYILNCSIYILVIGLPIAIIVLNMKTKGIRRKLVFQFSGFYILGHFIFLAFDEFFHSFLVLYMILPFLYFVIHIPPLLSLIRNSKKMGFPAYLSDSPQEDFKSFFLDHKISPRESEIALLLFEGLSNKEIEDKLFISQKTVKNHIYKIYKKAGVSSRVQFFNKLLQLKSANTPKE